MKSYVKISLVGILFTFQAYSYKYEKEFQSYGYRLIRIGTNYGGWTIPKYLLYEKSICYCAGAGEDISFDLGLTKRYKCNVFTIDPTPRAQKHIEYIREQITNNQKASINKSQFYSCTLTDLEKINFIPVGLWKENIIMKFYQPHNPAHVSHSILNLQKTKKYFEAPCKRLSTLMNELGHDHIDLLKLDIEGAEYAVLDSIIEDNLDIKCICVEFDEFAGVNKGKNKDLKASEKRVAQRINSLINHGYEIIYKKDFTDITFLRK